MVVVIEALALQLIARKLLKFSSKIKRSGLDVVCRVLLNRASPTTTHYLETKGSSYRFT